MDNKPSFQRELILPILLGGLSVLGIGVVFVLGRLSDARYSAPPGASETPYRYIYLGTEPGLSTLTPEATDTPVATATGDLTPLTTLVPPTEIISLPTRQPSQTPTASPTLASILSKFDDTYFELLYDGDWVGQSDVPDVYQNTLHLSFTINSSVSFTFVGEKVIVSYQSGPSLGRISITLDGIQFEVDQSSTSTQLVEWQSAVLVRGTHTIVITHISGGSINLDSITIPDISTPTPTVTATMTP